MQNFKKQYDFYLRHFNLAPTDFLYIDEAESSRREVALRAHIDRGEDFVDHHTFSMTTNAISHVYHCSFEVHDLTLSC